MQGRKLQDSPIDGKPLGIAIGAAFQLKISRRTPNRPRGRTLGTGPERIEIRARLRPGHTRERSASGTGRAASGRPRRCEESPAWQTQTHRALDATKSHECGAREGGGACVQIISYPTTGVAGRGNRALNRELSGSPGPLFKTQCDVSWDSQRRSNCAERRARLD